MGAHALASVMGLAAFVACRIASADPLLFEERTANLGTQPCVDSMNPQAQGCYSNYVVMADLNGDRYLDIVFANGGGYFVPDTTAPLALYINDGTGGFVDESAARIGGFVGRVRQIAIGDVNGDGALDLYVPDGYGMQSDALFINDGSGNFTDEAARLAISSHAGAARFGDLDDDGDLDLVVTDWGDQPPVSIGTARVYLNDGVGNFHEKIGAVPQMTSNGGTGPVDVDLFDADGDLRLDMVIANRAGNSIFLRGDGTGSFVDDASFPKQPGPYVYGPDECDVDGDGDLDMWLDNGGANHTEQLLINDGTGHFTDETATRVTGNPDFVDDNVVKCADVNGDGALDAVIGSLSGDRRVLINDGTGHFTLYDGAFPAQSISTLGVDVGDVDGDGRLDVITAQGEMGPFLNRLYIGTDAVARDVRPPVFRFVETLADGTPAGNAIVHVAVSDEATTDVGPRVQSVTIQTSSNTPPIAATFSGGDLFRAVIPVASSRVTYRACAIDFAGNEACSAQITFLPRGAHDLVPSGMISGSGCACSSRRSGPRRSSELMIGFVFIALALRRRARLPSST